MGESVLVTGGAGFIGSHLVDALLAQGHAVRVFDNLEPQVHGECRESGTWPDYCNPAAEYVLGDVRDRDALRKAIAGADVVFHEAAAVGIAQSMYEVERYVDANTRGTAVLLDILANDASIRGHLRKLIVASSMSIYGEGRYGCDACGLIAPRLRSEAHLRAQDYEMDCPICGEAAQPLPTDEDKPLHATSIYAITKKDQEEMCLTVGRAYGIPTVALRYFNTYGPRQALSNPYAGAPAIFSGRLLNHRSPVIFEDGKQSRDMTHVSDIVQANLLAMDCDGMDDVSFNVGTGRALTILDIAEALIAHLGSDQVPEITRTFRAGDIRHCFADISRIRAFGYEPSVRFEDGIADLVDWVRSQTAVDRFDGAKDELVRRGLAQ